MYLWFNGKLVNNDDPSPALPVTAGGVLLGLGVFTTIGIWHGKAFALDRHYQRLTSNAFAMELDCPFGFAEFTAGLEELIRANGVQRGIARLTITARGDGRWSTDAGCDLSMLAQSSTDEARPLVVGWSPFRLEVRSATAGIKVTSYAEHWLAWREARRRGLDEAILCNGAGALCEASRSNLLWTRDESLFTPALSTGCLPGIARELVLEWGREDGFAVREASFAPSELENADTILLTNAATGVRLAVMEDSQDKQNAAADVLADHLMRRWKNAVNS